MFTHPCRDFKGRRDEVDGDAAGVRKLSQVVKRVAGRCTVKL